MAAALGRPPAWPTCAFIGYLIDVWGDCC